jgi:hypothetical protein
VKTEKQSNTSLIVIFIVVVVVLWCSDPGWFVRLYRRRTKPREEEVTASRPSKDNHQIDTPGTWNAVMALRVAILVTVYTLVSPSESLLTSKSLLRLIRHVGRTWDEAGIIAKNLQD